MTEPATRSRRRWLWPAVVIVLLGISIPPATYLSIRWAGDRELATVQAELDAADPNWRMPDLFAARDAALRKLTVNSADTAAAAIKLLPDGWDRTDPEARWPGDGPPNRLPAADEAERLRVMHARAAPALAVARALVGQPDGGTICVVPDFGTYMLNIDLVAVQARRQVAQALSIDGSVAALDDDPAAAVRAAHAGLNVARSIGDEPFLISQLVRVACTAVSVRSAERVLALCEPDAGLADLQAAFGRETGEPIMRHGLRGELASVDQIMSNMRAGRVAGTAGGLPSGATLNPYFPHDHAFALRHIRRAVEDCDRPAHTGAAVAEMERAVKAEPRYRVMLSALLMPAIDKCSVAGTRVQASLATATVGIACERYRQANGRWPATLAELPKELLPVVPADPFDGRPLRYKRTADGVVVYSIGDNRADDGGLPNETGRFVADVVFRLYDPTSRRLPPLPPDPAPADDP